MPEDYTTWTDEKLRRRANQEWEMAGLARQDNDQADSTRRMALARKYEAEIRSRR